MKKRFLIVLLAVCAMTVSNPVVAHAADLNVRDHSIEKGTWSIQFALQSCFEVNTFNGMFSIKNHITDKSAIRFGVGYNLNKESSDAYSINTYDFMTVIAYIRYPRPLKNMKIYWGGGPTFEYEDDYRQSSFYVQSEYFRSYGFGLTGLCGVEWFVKKEIGLFAEYQAVGLYRDIESTWISFPEGSEWEFNLNKVFMGISAYF